MFTRSRIWPLTKASGFGALLVAQLVAPVTAGAQLRVPHFGVAASAAIPAGGIYSVNGFKTGWQGMAFVAFRIRDWPVGLRLDGSYSVNTSNQPINGAAADHKVELRGWDADVTFTFPSPGPVRGYVLAGSGLYNVTYNITRYFNPGGWSASHQFTYNLGAGFTVGPLFVEARYVHVDGFGNDVSYILVPITAGLRIGGW
jgi:hypothetical protein